MTDDELVEGLVGLLRLGMVVIVEGDDVDGVARFWPIVRRDELRTRWNDGISESSENSESLDVRGASRASSESRATAATTVFPRAGTDDKPARPERSETAL
jgi:hypothetical protein